MTPDDGSPASQAPTRTASTGAVEHPLASPAATDTAPTTLKRARDGSSSALSELIRRHLLPLRRWTHGRVPNWMRRVADTGDLVQNALVQTLRHLPTFAPKSHATLAVYLRQAVLNQIRDEHRRLQRRGLPVEPADTLIDPSPSPLDEATAEETRTRYLKALQELRPSDRELVVAHVELGYSHEQLACMTGKRTNAARMALKRALERLALRMRDE